jgi:hypothetical protein
VAVGVVVDVEAVVVLSLLRRWRRRRCRRWVSLAVVGWLDSPGSA